MRRDSFDSYVSPKLAKIFIAVPFMVIGIGTIVEIFSK